MKEHLKLIKRLWRHIAKRRKFQFLMLLVLMVISAFAEVVSLGSVLPFLGALSSPETIFNHEYAIYFVDFLKIETPEDIVMPLAVIFALAAIFAGLIRLILSWFSIYISNACSADLSIKVYETTLYQPFHIHLYRNSSEVIAGIQKITSAQTVVNACLSMISSTVLIIFIMSALLVIDRNVALIAAAFFVICYAFIISRLKNQLESNSDIAATHLTRMFKALQEGLGGIREVLLDGSQKFYTSIFRKAQIPAMLATSKNTFLTAAPRNIMEALSLCLIALLAYSLSREQDALTSALPILAALALGAQRMLPAIQMLYGGWAGIVGNSSQLEDALELLDQDTPIFSDINNKKPLSFQNNICFEDVYFKYKDDKDWVLQGVNLEIKKGDKVAFVGVTGSGKSTILNILMGLLEPTKGSVKVDGEIIDNSSYRSWQSGIAHVPQSIYLADNTIAENIAFGTIKENIELDKLKMASSIAQIKDFIEAKTDSFDTVIGEFGIRLSGGQRQRIGIARALYKPSDVLILDEATSALDNATEAAVVNALESFDNDLTIIIVAHRITTIMGCDNIIEIKNGQVSNQGRYEELLKKSDSFSNMVNIRKENESDIID
jgi:ATP-binding cassette, subfamily B, bacterial PglK